MTLLEAHNQILALLGMPPINSLSAGNSIASKISASIDRARKRILRAAPYKFGVQTDLTANADSEIAVSHYLRVIYPEQLQRKLTERNGIVWDIENNQAYTETIKDAIIVNDIAFDQISSYAWQ